MVLMAYAYYPEFIKRVSKILWRGFEILGIWVLLFMVLKTMYIDDILPIIEENACYQNGRLF